MSNLFSIQQLKDLVGKSQDKVLEELGEPEDKSVGAAHVWKYGDWQVYFDYYGKDPSCIKEMQVMYIKLYLFAYDVDITYYDADPKRIWSINIGTDTNQFKSY